MTLELLKSKLEKDPTNTMLVNLVRQAELRQELEILESESEQAYLEMQEIADMQSWCTAITIFQDVFGISHTQYKAICEYLGIKATILLTLDAYTEQFDTLEGIDWVRLSKFEYQLSNKGIAIKPNSDFHLHIVSLYKDRYAKQMPKILKALFEHISDSTESKPDTPKPESTLLTFL